MTLIIQDAGKGNCAKVTEQGYLCVCICDTPHEMRANLQRLLEAEHGCLLFIERDGEIVPLADVMKAAAEGDL